MIALIALIVTQFCCKDMEMKTLYKYLVIIICIIVVAALIVILVLFSGKSSSISSSHGQKMVIDHDGGADDAMAIFLALLYEKYFDGPKIVGLTTCYGNVNEEQVFKNSQRILDIAQRTDVPIYRGSGQAVVKDFPSDFFFGKDGLGDLDDVQFEPIAAADDHAVFALIDMSKEFEGELTVVGIGPVTNIALASRLDPDFIGRLAHLYIGAGNINSTESPDPEFNALLDVEAYHIVAENSTPEKVTFIPFSPFSEFQNSTKEWRENVLGAINTTIMQQQNQFERISSNGTSIWKLLDPNAMSMVLNNDLIKEQRCTNNSIILCGEERGINTNNFTDCAHSNMKLAYPGPDQGFMNFLFEVFSAELNNENK